MTDAEEAIRRRYAILQAAATIVAGAGFDPRAWELDGPVCRTLITDAVDTAIRLYEKIMDRENA